MASELIVRKPTYAAFEYKLRDAITDEETRFRIAGELLFYIEHSPRRTDDERKQFRKELESLIGAIEAERLITSSATIYNANRLLSYGVKAVWLILFVFGIWVAGSRFINWGWSPFVSLLAAAFSVGALLELAKWALLLFLFKRRS